MLDTQPLSPLLRAHCNVTAAVDDSKQGWPCSNKSFLQSQAAAQTWAPGCSYQAGPGPRASCPRGRTLAWVCPVGTVPSRHTVVTGAARAGQRGHPAQDPAPLPSFTGEGRRHPFVQMTPQLLAKLSLEELVGGGGDPWPGVPRGTARLLSLTTCCVQARDTGTAPSLSASSSVTQGHRTYTLRQGFPG